VVTSLWLIAHADDETLSTGVAIANHVQAGNNVIVVLATDGINSSVRGATGLTRTQFSAARDREFEAAVRVLGATPYFSPFRAEDGKLTIARARDIITDARERWVGARVKTHSPYGASFRHPDHVALGGAAMEILQQDPGLDLRLYVEPYVAQRFRTEFPGIAIATETAPNPTPVIHAIDEYALVDHTIGRYGIGYLSVPSYFDALRTELASFRHHPQ
jgi:LmbE family N-acetylglucosaminyl deacetylase